MDSMKYLIVFFQTVFIIYLSSTDNAVNGQQIAKKYEPNWASIDSRPLPQWFDESKIGIFIHWGLFSVPSFDSEWFWWNWIGAKKPALVDFMKKNYRPDFTYADFAKQYTAEFYDPNRWAKLFKASGAKYVVLTGKHHEGFTLWPSKTSWNWNAVDVGPNRDLLGDLSKAVRNVGLKFGAYHSWMEWFNPIYVRDQQAKLKTQDFIRTKARPELEELVNIYKPDILWSDGDWQVPDTYLNSTDFLAWLYNESPVKDTIVVNDRWGLGTACKHGGYYSCADRYNPGVLQHHKWENAMTLDKTAWGYRRDSPLSNYQSTDDLISILAKTVSCNGNLLINIGPTHDGRIVPIFEERLLELGDWLKINGEAIYSSKPWIHQNDTITQNIWYTSKGSAVYSIVLDWPKNNAVVLGSVDHKVVDTIQLLGIKGNLAFKESANGTQVTFPHLNPDSLKWAYVLKINTK